MRIKPENSHRASGHTLGGWMIPILLTFAMIMAFAGFAKGTSAEPPAQNALPTATSTSEVQQNPGSGPVNGQTTGDLDALLLQIQQTMQTL